MIFELIFGLVYGLFELVLHIVVETLLQLFAAILLVLGRTGLINESKVRHRINLFVLWIFVPTMILLMLVVGVTFVQDRLARKRIDKTRALVVAVARDLVKKLEADGEFSISRNPKALDAWGNALVVSEEKGLLQRTVKVISSGQDLTFSTVDDIEGTAKLTLSKKEFGRNLLDRLKNAGLHEKPSRNDE